MPLTSSTFKQAVHGLFEWPLEEARRILPARLQPLEVHHGTSLLSISAFDFSASPVGPYAELALSIIVAPLITGEGEHWPNAAYFTFMLAANSRAAWEQGDSLPLPYWREELSIQFASGAGCVQVGVVADGASVIELRVHEHSWQPAHHRYQCFLARDGQHYCASIDVDGEESEHEDGKGRLGLAAHPLIERLDIASIDETPVRETWLRHGQQALTGLRAL